MANATEQLPPHSGELLAQAGLREKQPTNPKVLADPPPIVGRLPYRSMVYAGQLQPSGVYGERLR
jgi:hypothetical protein